MAIDRDSIQQLLQELNSTSKEESRATILAITQQALQQANSNRSHNTYLWSDKDWTMAEARRIADLPAQGRPPLFGITVSVKDCFDLAGAPTTCGTRFYRDLNGTATEDSWLVKSLRTAGAIITGKTHLHPLAYGITGENAEFVDCLQPTDPTSLTGGSSSGAAASILERSAMAAIGTDTGGSIRVPAALCGIAGYRASLGRGHWRGAAHLAPSFDTMGWLFHDLEDGPLLGSIFGDTNAQLSHQPTTFAVIPQSFLSDCEPAVLAAYHKARVELESLDLTAREISVDWWADSSEIFTSIQASEAAQIHQGHFAEFEPAIRQRLEWGASLDEPAITGLRTRHAHFNTRMHALLAGHHLLLMPAVPVTRLAAGADHSQTRTRLLRYTTPVSLAGLPAVTLPYTAMGKPAGGMQLIGAHQADAQLLAFAARIGAARKTAYTSMQ